MKSLLIASMTLLPAMVCAQNYGPAGMDKAQMQQMMQGAQAMQSCMKNIDEAEMQAFQNKAQAMDIEVKTLCASGKRDAAMSRAMAFGKETASSPLMQQMKKCGENMRHMMPKVATTGHNDDGSAPRHICDAR